MLSWKLQHFSALTFQEGKVTKLFEWSDGPLVLAMKEGAMFLCDEISLADDSVLERLNSVLEPERTLVLAEKGSSSGSSQQDVDTIFAAEHFRVVSTMNPGGDFGKKEVAIQHLQSQRRTTLS